MPTVFVNGGTFVADPFGRPIALDFPQDDCDFTAWLERTTAFTASDADAGDQFGSACALSADGDVLAVGAQYRDGAAGVDQGAVYVYDCDSA
jgi:hypothetical protein